MNLNEAIFQVIDLHTFSSVWYWLAVAVVWSTVSHWIIGVPFDMIHRAKRHGDQALTDLEMLVAINVRRLTIVTDMAGLWIAGFTAFILSGLLMSGFFYNLEMAQGMFCLGLPLTVVAMMNLRLSRRLASEQLQGEALIATLMKLRFYIQFIGMASIFATALYGMYRNLSLPLGF